jgi:hypothetical protein
MKQLEVHNIPNGAMVLVANYANQNSFIPQDDIIDTFRVKCVGYTSLYFHCENDETRLVRIRKYGWLPFEAELGTKFPSDEPHSYTMTRDLIGI